MTRTAPINVRLRQRRETLVTDRVMTTTQAEHLYGLTEQDIRGRYPARDVLLRPLNTSAREVTCTFVALDENLIRWEPGWSLAHTAFTGEIRRHLGAPPSEWEPEGVHGQGNHRPDALWRRPDGRLLVAEYDAGYTPATVRRKVQAFTDGTYDELVWATPSRVRTAHLQRQYAGPGRTFMTVGVADLTRAIAAARAPRAGGDDR